MALLCFIATYNDKALAEDLIYYGITDGHGNPTFSLPLKNEYSKIDIRITGAPNDIWSKTTEALSIESKEITVKGENTSVTIINTVRLQKLTIMAEFMLKAIPLLPLQKKLLCI